MTTDDEGDDPPLYSYIITNGTGNETQMTTDDECDGHLCKQKFLILPHYCRHVLQLQFQHDLEQKYVNGM